MAKNSKRHKIKQDGFHTNNWCTCCQNLGCDPYGCVHNSIAEQKRRKRAMLGQCRGCGKEKCICRSSEYRKW